LEKNMTKDILNKWRDNIGISSDSEIEGNLETPKEKSCSYSVNEIQTMITILLSLYNSSDSDKKEEISQILFDIQYMLLSFHRDLDISGVEDISGLKVKQNEFLKDQYNIVYSKDFGEKMLEEENELFRKMPKLTEPRLGSFRKVGFQEEVRSGEARGQLLAAVAEEVDRNLDEAIGEAFPVANNNEGNRTPNQPIRKNQTQSTVQGSAIPQGSPDSQARSSQAGILSLGQGSQPPDQGSASVSAVVSPFGSPGARRRATTGNQSSSDSEAPPPPPATRRMNQRGGSRRKQKNKNKKKSKNPLYSKTYKGKGKRKI
jgi:hypothetical protein